MSPYINRDRLIYIAPNPSPPLPKETIIAGHPCRIWHKSQKNYCKRCDSHGHRTSDIGLCQSYEADESVSPFRADSNPLSNFFKCTITIQGREFHSSEHAYQYTKCMFLHDTDLAEQVLSAETPHDAKAVASRINCHVRMAEWVKIRVDVMSKILRFKWNSSGRFRQTLMATSNLTIAKATSDMFWGVGLAPNLAFHTNPQKFLGSNHLGKCLMELRSKIHDLEPTSINDISFSPSPLRAQRHSSMTSDVNPSTSGAQEDSSDTNALTQHFDICEIFPNNIEEPSTNDTSSSNNMDTSPVESTTVSDELLSTNQNASEPPNVESSAPSTSSVTSSGKEDINSDCELLPPALFSDPIPSDEDKTLVPSVNIRKSRSLKPELRRNLSQSSLDSYLVSRESSTKRKPSGDVTVSPSSDHVTKVSRSDGGDAVS